MQDSSAMHHDSQSCNTRSAGQHRNGIQWNRNDAAQPSDWTFNTDIFQPISNNAWTPAVYYQVATTVSNRTTNGSAGCCCRCCSRPTNGIGNATRVDFCCRPCNVLFFPTSVCAVQFCVQNCIVTRTKRMDQTNRSIPDRHSMLILYRVTSVCATKVQLRHRFIPMDFGSVG